MRKRPLSLLLCSFLFLFFPLAYFNRLSQHAFENIRVFDVILWVVFPVLLLVGLIRVTRVGWYTLVGFVALWGVVDLYEYYSSRGTSVMPLLVHLGIYSLSLAYFINPRIRHLYFDPRMRWWRTKPRFETHMPFIYRFGNQWNYPILGNLSEGGCFVETAHPMNVNSEIQISIPLPVPLNVSVIKMRGEVRWVSRHPGRYGMGVQFKDLPPEHLHAIRLFVHNHL